ncbi:LOW QUALITY PROTEIN: cysteine desulfurase, mitochondrial-like [Pempheris klunzingeri]|uniref:LOW QUALITY PROTEIN: cysteine desulfurase, mitochondrial-like n=1 Tax=Pempheris klunzingeri TaxID=3127111 RepID=UPI00397F207C
MWPYFTEKYGNCHSKTHCFGWETEIAVEKARKEIAALINAKPKEIIFTSFTSGATECNNMALKLLKSTITDDTLIVSVMTVNNEIGVIQPIKEIGKICRENNIFFHTDAAQAFGKIPIDVNEYNIDLMSISGHKIYGPKGVGALYIRSKPRIRLVPLINGGGQERGLRSGTLPVPLVVGFGEAARVAKIHMKENYDKIKHLSDKLVTGITNGVTHIVRNGDENPDGGYPGCVNFSFSCVEGESLLMALKDIALSSGSACTSASLEPSYVLRAIGAEDDLAHSSIRFGISIYNTEEEIDYIVGRVIKEVNRLRQMSPLWEMVQEGVDLNSIDWGHSQHH